MPIFSSGSVIFAGTNGILSQSNANFFWDNTNRRLGIGTTSPANRLDVSGSIGVNTSGQTITISTFQGAGTDGSNIFIGGGGSGTPGQASTKGGGFSSNGSYNTAIGVNSFTSNTTGQANTIYGYNALSSNTVGTSNVAIGYQALQLNTTGSSNTAIGLSALVSNTSGSSNTAIGQSALSNNTTGSNNVGLGHSAGRYITGGVTVNSITNNSIFLGYDTRAAANNQTNQIVIGFQETGLGSNTTIIGNSSTLTTALRGNVLIGTIIDAAYSLQVQGSGSLSGSLYVSGSSLLSGSLNVIGNTTITGSLLLSTDSMFGLPLTSSAAPVTGSMYWSGSLLFIYNGTRYMSASFV
jgi:hypothetical protein